MMEKLQNMVTMKIEQVVVATSSDERNTFFITQQTRTKQEYKYGIHQATW